MKVQLKENTFLNSDNKCYWVTKEYTDDNTGKVVEKRYTGYFGRLDYLLEDYFESHVRESNPKDIKELQKEVVSAKEEVREIGKEIVKQLKG